MTDYTTVQITKEYSKKLAAIAAQTKRSKAAQLEVMIDAIWGDGAQFENDPEADNADII